MRKYRELLITSLILLPNLAFAQAGGIKDLIKAFGGLINPMITILIGVALLVFFWGLVRFIYRVGGDETAVSEGRTLMVWGLIALFVMVAVWGIIGFAQRNLNLPRNPPPLLGP
jgi:hypothetical protein